MKKIRSVLPIILAIVIFVLLSLLIYLNKDDVFLFLEDLGINKEKTELSLSEEIELEAVACSELEKSEKVEFDRSLMLVNKENMLPEGFAPVIKEYKTSTVYMDEKMIEPYMALSSFINEETRKKLYVSSDFREEDEQRQLYLEDPLTATLPGASEHQSGLALDLYVAYFSGDGFIKSRAGRLVNSECCHFGFIIRYPHYGEDITGIRFEPWHIRYVGIPHSEIIYNNTLTLEEYINSLEIGMFYECGDYLISRQEIAETLIMPKEYSRASISPDNMGNYIITVNK